MIRCAFAAAWASWQGVIELELPVGATVADALSAAEAALRGRGHEAASAAESAGWQHAAVGIFGEVCGRERVLCEGDRVELYRPLMVDPKSARRARAATVRSTAVGAGSSPGSSSPGSSARRAGR